MKILRLGQECQVLPVSADVSTVKKYLEIMMANRSAARSYTVTKPIQTDLHLFQVQELSPLDPVSFVIRAGGTSELPVRCGSIPSKGTIII